MEQPSAAPLSAPDKLDSLLQPIMFNPLSYLHKQRLPLCSAQTTLQQKSVINDLLIAHYQLCITWTPPTPMPPILFTLLEHWYRLPQVAYLLGCHTLRATLCWRDEWRRLPAWAQRFALIPAASSAIPTQRGTLTQNRILQAGYQLLTATYDPLPIPLASRLALMFPEKSSEQTMPMSQANFLLVKLALHYAQTYPHALPPTRH
jgi:type III secretion system OrgA/MxiK family protein